MRCQPRILLDHPVRRPKISLILIDWGVRESFHSLYYLNRQTVPRDEYELIWLEFYDHEPAGLRQMIQQAGYGRPAVDRWFVLGYPGELIYHKHRLYNVGILAARGEVCVVCDSDAIYTPRFIERLIRAFEETPHGIIHLDQVRSNSRRFYPFNYPTIEEVMHSDSNARGCGTLTTIGLLNPFDRIHDANFGACFAARRQDLLAIGGADEHIDYLGYMCGPYDMTFRLSNLYGVPEQWLDDEFLFHTWHPNTTGINTDYHGPHDGRSMSLRALHARASYRIQPYLRSPLMRWPWTKRRPPVQKILELLAARPEPTWCVGATPTGSDEVYWGMRSKSGYNLFCHRNTWYALPIADGYFRPERYAARRYPNAIVSNDVFQLERQVERRAGGMTMEPTGKLARLLWRLREEPLSSIPLRLWRNIQRQVISRLSPCQSPWS